MARREAAAAKKTWGESTAGEDGEIGVSWPCTASTEYKGCSASPPGAVPNSFRCRQEEHCWFFPSCLRYETSKAVTHVATFSPSFELGPTGLFEVLKSRGLCEGTQMMSCLERAGFLPSGHGPLDPRKQRGYGVRDGGRKGNGSYFLGFGKNQKFPKKHSENPAPRLSSQATPFSGFLFSKCL